LAYNSYHNDCAALEIKLPYDDEIILIAEGFRQKSTSDGAIYGYVGALDGFLIRLKGPSPEEFGGNVSGYYSGHYC
jgi:hypothetical protein